MKHIVEHLTASINTWRRSKSTKRHGEYQRRVSQMREVNVSAWLRAVELDDARDKVLE